MFVQTVINCKITIRSRIMMNKQNKKQLHSKFKTKKTYIN